MLIDNNRNISFYELSWRKKLISTKPSSEHLFSYAMQALQSNYWAKTLEICNVAFFNVFVSTSLCLAHWGFAHWDFAHWGFAHCGFDRFSLCSLVSETTLTEAHSTCNSLVSGFDTFQYIGIGHSAISWAPSQTILLCLLAKHVQIRV